MPTSTSLVAEHGAVDRVVGASGDRGRGSRLVAAVSALLAGVLLLGAVVLGASAWHMPEATLFHGSWWSVLAAVPVSAVTVATLGVLIGLASLFCLLMQRWLRSRGSIDLVALMVVTGLGLGGSVTVAAAVAALPAATGLGNSYVRAAAAVARTDADVTATSDARGGQSPSAFEARMSPEAHAAFVIDYHTARPGATTLSLHLTAATATLAGPWVEETVRVYDRWSIGEEDDSDYTCLIDPITGHIEAIWWQGL